MADLTEPLRQALRTLQDPQSGQDLIAAGLLDSLTIERGLVHAALRTDRAHAPAMEPVRAEAERLLARQPGVLNATVTLTAHRAPAAPPPTTALPGIRHAIAIASGKGGVGKSTLATNLAVALARQGLRVGMLDADIYGPSLPRMLGMATTPRVEDGIIQPIDAWGLKAMSIGLLVNQDAAMIWRGPMVMGALNQLLTQVAWGELDVMILDMPPGTGDAQLTISQKVKLSGALIVSTPQDIALIDARRGVRMFEKVNVPVLGFVENMSYFCCPNCDHRTDLFGHGGARREAAQLGVPFLGEIPLLLEIRETADAGTPIVAASPASPAAQAFAAIAAAVWARLP